MMEKVTKKRLKEIKKHLDFIQFDYDRQGYISTNTADELIEYSKYLIEKVEQLQQENERLNTLLDQSRAGKLTVSRRLEFAEEEIDRLKADIEEALELLKRGGTGTRSQVQRLLEQALEGSS
jgi:ribosomal protein S18